MGTSRLLTETAAKRYTHWYASVFWLSLVGLSWFERAGIGASVTDI